MQARFQFLTISEVLLELSRFLNSHMQYDICHSRAGGKPESRSAGFPPARVEDPAFFWRGMTEKRFELGFWHLNLESRSSARSNKFQC